MNRSILLALALTACSGRNAEVGTPEPAPTITPDPAPVTAPTPAPTAPVGTAQSAGEAVNALGLALAPRLFSNNGGNEVYSPISISLAFGLLAAGAAGETEAELYRVLNLDPATADAELATLMKAASDLDARPDTSLAIANRLWLDNTLTILDSYATTSREQFGAEAERVDFMNAPEPSRETINAWVSDNTQGFIPSLFAQGTIQPSTRMALTNAVYFKADWDEPFDPDATMDRPFTKADGTVIEVPTMAQNTKFAYAEDGNAQILMMPYRGYTLDFVVVLPTDGDLDAAMGLITDERLDTWARTARTHQVDVQLPRFEFRASYLSLIAALTDMGAPTAFTPDADFSNLSETESLYADQAIHKAYIKVDEVGTEAAAATGLTMRTTGMPAPPPPATFHADQPFWFGVRDRGTGALLFAGRVTEPVEEG